MHEAADVPAWVPLAYLISGVCFILALRGLSSPESSRRGNRAGMIGMLIAVVTTLVMHIPGAASGTPRAGYAYAFELDTVTLVQIFAAILIGAVIGLTTARRIA